MKKTERNPYIAPAVEVVANILPVVLYTASPGVGSGYDPGTGFDAKKSDLNIEFRDLWED